MREHELSRKGAISRTLQVLDFEDNKEHTGRSRRVGWGVSPQLELEVGSGRTLPIFFYHDTLRKVRTIRGFSEGLALMT
jgi:hypothetical protein